MALYLSVAGYMVSVWVAYHMGLAHYQNFLDELAEMFHHTPEPLDDESRRFCFLMGLLGPLEILVVLLREAMVRDHPYKRLWVW